MKINDVERPILFLLAHAGGSSLSYSNAFKRLDKYFAVTPLELPGHGARLADPLALSVEEMVDDLSRQALGYLATPKPYSIFGHSLGAVNAFLLAGSLRTADLGNPGYLFLSSACIPGQHRVEPKLLDLTDAELWRASADYFGTFNRDVVSSEELMILFAPILRADLGVILAYQPQAPLAPLDVPLISIYADHDIVRIDDMKQWKHLTNDHWEIKCLPGGHFHPLENPEAVEDLILTACGLAE